MEDKKVMKVAVQIDAENISWKYAKRIFDEASNLGVVVCKRIYGDSKRSIMESTDNGVLHTGHPAVPKHLW